jgi:DNA-directed RNA polymerase subunit M/transcription elongation factor TFIIS
MSCPKCGSTLIQTITNASRCGQCGHQFGLVKNPVPKIERFQGSGFKPHEPLKP